MADYRDDRPLWLHVFADAREWIVKARMARLEDRRHQAAVFVRIARRLVRRGRIYRHDAEYDRDHNLTWGE